MGGEAKAKRKYVRTEYTELMDLIRDEFKPRNPHIQEIEGNEPSVNKPFAGTQFVAFINKPMKQLASGEMEVTMTIPFEFKDLAFELSNALCFPLSIDVQLWKVFKEAVEEDG